MTDDIPTPEFSRPVSVAKLGSRLASYTIEANEAERAALAERFELVSLGRLVAEVALHRDRGDIRVEGKLEASLVQSCVVTLEPVPEEIDESFVVLYRPGLDEDEADRLALEDPDGDLVEPLAGDAIDIGEAVAQSLSVAMEPYPRAPGVELPEIDDGEETEDAAAPEGSRPFDALAGLKRRI